MFPSWLSDLQIINAPVSSEITNAMQHGVLWQAAPDRFLLDVPGVARYLVEDGGRVTMEPAPSVEHDELLRFAHTMPLAALLYQRGMFAFHAAAVVPPVEMILQNSSPLLSQPSHQAILLAGDSGAGKSSLLATLLQRGWRMLSDDLACVGWGELGQTAVFPLHPEILLWEDALKKLNNQDLTSSKTLSNGKQVFSMTGQYMDVPLPLRAIYWLTVQSAPRLESEMVRGQKFFQAINQLLYNSHVADALLDRGAHFRLASALTKTVTLHRLYRQRGMWTMEKLADLIESESK